ncbi:acetyl-CoA synthetase-like protein [Aspergillus homomorphus CBS 101889]|uniref:Acetyl-CoA synthetase-like protein n=1 Tax=Aspergillus homomorphus (strain CBS 101889) TaxID=1450537 RepID=A0A395HYR3_ASPHC|nr:acetyl-CoA synthetase-like protein [Aspergillus homomorphus CBS 101889]RAL12676.1 acetyl-CoA synthetase-like protein [Aspergillus homomorphus CBS 101889]
MPFTKTSIEDQCVTQIILRRCHEQPDVTAISAWDGEVAYGELERQSARLATKLLKLGISPKRCVTIVLDKSKWMMVATLGVIRAGGSFLMVDVSHPFERIEKIIRTIAALLLVFSYACVSLVSRLADAIVVIEDVANFAEQSIDDKALRQQHADTTIECLALTVRVDGFTVCNREVLLMLMVGGCLCIPSEDDRNQDLTGFISRHRVNYTFLPPIIASQLDPAAVPTLRVLLLGGHIHRDLSTNGLDQTCPFHAGCDARNVGFSCDYCLWVVEVDNPNHLVPVGAVGELLLQGKGLARGYSADEEIDRRVFLKGADWQARHPLHVYSTFGERLYRTGDLVRYNLDGSIQYISQKDNLIKVDGEEWTPGRSSIT